MSTNNKTTTETESSPWFENMDAAALLNEAAADGAVIKNETTYLANWPDELPTDDWFLDVNFGTKGDVRVRYTSEAGFWLLSVDTMVNPLEGVGATVEDTLEAARAVGRAAELCIKLNGLTAATR